MELNVETVVKPTVLENIFNSIWLFSSIRARFTSLVKRIFTSFMSPSHTTRVTSSHSVSKYNAGRIEVEIFYTKLVIIALINLVG